MQQGAHACWLLWLVAVTLLHMMTWEQELYCHCPSTIGASSCHSGYELNVVLVIIGTCYCRQYGNEGMHSWHAL